MLLCDPHAGTSENYRQTGVQGQFYHVIFLLSIQGFGSAFVLPVESGSSRIRNQVHSAAKLIGQLSAPFPKKKWTQIILVLLFIHNISFCKYKFNFRYNYGVIFLLAYI